MAVACSSGRRKNTLATGIPAASVTYAIDQLGAQLVALVRRKSRASYQMRCAPPGSGITIQVADDPATASSAHLLESPGVDP